MKAVHFVSKIATDNNAVAVAYNTGYTQLSMGFKAVSYGRLDKMLTNETDNGWYEVLDYETPRKIFFDIDFYEGDMTMYNKYKDYIFEAFGAEGIEITGENIKEYGYVGEKKGKSYLSYHIIVNNGFVAKNQIHLKGIIDYMILKYPKLSEMIDCGVYNKFRNFRLPYQAKNGDSNAIQKILINQPQ